MKRIHSLLVLIFFCVGLNAQWDFWGEKSIILRNDYQQLDESDFNEEIEHSFYGFLSNDEFYVLAYRVEKEPEWIIKEKKKAKGWINDTTRISFIEDTVVGRWYKQEFSMLNLKPDNSYYDAVKNTSQRDLILYRSKDCRNWVEASNTAQIDYRVAGHTFTFTGEKPEVVNFEYHSFLINKALGSGKVRILNNGCVIMLLTNEYNRHPQRYNAVVIFVPNGDSTYTATRFEPLQKETRVPELRAGDTLIINETNNEIELEFWERYESKENENPDGFIIYNSDTGGKDYKIFYKRELFTKLNFSVSNNGKVTYTGEYKLFQKD